MILHKIMDAKAPCGTHRSDAVKVFSFSDFVIAELFSSAIFLPSCHPERSPKGEVEGSRTVLPLTSSSERSGGDPYILYQSLKIN